MNVYERKAIALTALAIVVWFCLVGGVIYVALHFVTKFW